MGGLYGTVWGACAAAVFVAMRGHLLPAPSEVAEIVGVTIACGTALGWAVSRVGR
jgi:hypothetical protein